MHLYKGKSFLNKEFERCCTFLAEMVEKAKDFGMRFIISCGKAYAEVLCFYGVNKIME